jgi:hypothetical protein
MRHAFAPLAVLAGRRLATKRLPEHCHSGLIHPGRTAEVCNAPPCLSASAYRSIVVGIGFMDLDEFFEVFDSEAGKSGRSLVVDVKMVIRPSSGSIFSATSDNESSSSPGIAAARANVKTALGAAMIMPLHAVREIGKTMEALRQAFWTG